MDKTVINSGSRAHTEQYVSDCKPGNKLQLLLQNDRTDIRFRCYDLLFRSYPQLSSRLPENRYDHPDIVALIDSDSADSDHGIENARLLLQALGEKSDYGARKFFRILRQKLLQATEEIMSDFISDEELSHCDRVVREKLNHASKKGQNVNTDRERQTGYQ